MFISVRIMQVLNRDLPLIHSRQAAAEAEAMVGPSEGGQDESGSHEMLQMLQIQRAQRRERLLSGGRHPLEENSGHPPPPHHHHHHHLGDELQVAKRASSASEALLREPVAAALMDLLSTQASLPDHPLDDGGGGHQSPRRRRDRTQSMLSSSGHYGSTGGHYGSFGSYHPMAIPKSSILRRSSVVAMTRDVVPMVSDIAGEDAHDGGGDGGGMFTGDAGFGFRESGGVRDPLGGAGGNEDDGHSGGGGEHSGGTGSQRRSRRSVLFRDDVIHGPMSRSYSMDTDCQH